MRARPVLKNHKTEIYRACSAANLLHFLSNTKTEPQNRRSRIEDGRSPQIDPRSSILYLLSSKSLSSLIRFSDRAVLSGVAAIRHILNRKGGDQLCERA